MTLNFGLLASITVREQVSVVLSHLVCVGHGSPRKRRQYAFLFCSDVGSLFRNGD